MFDACKDKGNKSTAQHKKDSSGNKMIYILSIQLQSDCSDGSKDLW